MLFSIQGCYNGDYEDDPLYFILDEVTAELMESHDAGDLVQIGRRYAARKLADSDSFRLYRLSTDL